MELTFENIIKIILGILVFSVVIFGVYLLFKNYILDFFKNILGGDQSILLSLIQ
ncbi:MAG: hypothetical protein KatS3mg001_372 [Candidatus Pacearchaeota archaeon]|nr:MAG: hypothetical protein KatS3mg001_372 [Candidatus Pacearchaeota archaeon]